MKKLSILDILLYTTICAFGFFLCGENVPWADEFKFYARMTAVPIWALLVMIWSKVLERSLADRGYVEAVILRIITTGIYTVFSAFIGLITCILIIYPTSMSIVMVPLGLITYVFSFAPISAPGIPDCEWSDYSI